MGRLMETECIHPGEFWQWKHERTTVLHMERASNDPDGGHIVWEYTKYYLDDKWSAGKFKVAEAAILRDADKIDMGQPVWLHKENDVKAAKNKNFYLAKERVFTSKEKEDSLYVGRAWRWKTLYPKVAFFILRSKSGDHWKIEEFPHDGGQSSVVHVMETAILGNAEPITTGSTSPSKGDDMKKGKKDKGKMYSCNGCGDPFLSSKMTDGFCDDCHALIHQTANETASTPALPAELMDDTLDLALGGDGDGEKGLLAKAKSTFSDIIGTKGSKSGGVITYPPSTGYSYGGSGYSSTYKACTHDGDHAVFYLPDSGIKFYAANSGGASYCAKHVDYFFDLAGVYHPSSTAGNKFVAGDEEFLELNDYATPVHVPRRIRLEWPDMGIPPVGNDFWLRLMEKIPPNSRVAFACQGGHGRTGTALCSILVAFNGWSADKAIAFVRKEHCSKAVESDTQVRYLRALEAAYKVLNAGSTDTDSTNDKTGDTP